MPIRLRQPIPQLIYETDTALAHYQIWDTVYSGRPARVLYTGQRQTAQSGLAVDDRPDLLFDYNQRFFELIDGLRPNRVLLIGGGVYTLPSAVTSVLATVTMDVVELDDQLEAIARDYFGLRSQPGLHIYHRPGRQFLEQSTERYDLILVDAFQNAETPDDLQGLAVARLLRDHLSETGVVAYNRIAVYRGIRGRSLHRHRQDLAKVFPIVNVYPARHGQSPWLPQNLLLIAQRRQLRDLRHILRYPSL